MNFLKQIFSGMVWNNFLDILLVGSLFYLIHSIFGKTNAWRGIVLLVLVWVGWYVASVMRLKLLAKILEVIINTGGMAILIIYASEFKAPLNSLIRRISKHTLDIFKVFEKGTETQDDEKVISGIAGGCLKMMEEARGGTIVLSGKDELPGLREATKVDIDVTVKNIFWIFDTKGPMHDGGMVIMDNKIVAVRMVLPLSEDPDLPADLGLRHRSAIGLTEVSDAFVIVVSEEKRITSIASESLNTPLKRNVSDEELRKQLRKFFERMNG